MYLLNEISSFLRDDLGLERSIGGLQPLAQWIQPTAFRVIFESEASPRSLIVKHIPGFEDSSVGEVWRPRWKIAQDYINLCFLWEVGAGAFAPRVHGYSQERNMLAIQDLGQTSLRDIEDIPTIATHGDLWQEAARALGRLATLCPCDPGEFETFARVKLPTFAPLRKWQDQNPDDCHSIVGIAREMRFGHITDLEKEVARLVGLATRQGRWIAYSVGDLWHQHVMFHDGRLKFIDFHCGGYDITVTDLMRLIEGTPFYQDRPLPPGIVATCKGAFFAELCSAGRLHLDRQEFEEVYDFTLVRHVAFMVAREVVELRRTNNREKVTKAVRAARQHLEFTKHARAITVDFLTELEELPNRWLNAGR